MLNDKNIYIFNQNTLVSKVDREKLLNQKAVLLWFTGLSGSGKTTIAKQLELVLYNKGYLTYLLDGDNIRSGLNRDLGFTKEARIENIRRIGHVAKLMLDSGLIVLAAFISPYEKSRNFIKNLVGKDNYIEIFIDCPLEICMERDPKRLYCKAENNEIKNFTGISDIFEKPLNPDIKISSNSIPPEDAVSVIMEYLGKKGYVKIEKRN